MAAAFVYFILPALLLIAGLPIFAVLILTSTAAIVFVAHAPLQALQTYMFGSLDNFRCWRCRSSCWPARSWVAAASPTAS